MFAVPSHFLKCFQDEDLDALRALRDELAVKLSFELAADLAMASSVLSPVAWKLERIFFDNKVVREIKGQLPRCQLGQPLLFIGLDAAGAYYGLVVKDDGTVLDGVCRWDANSDSLALVAASVKIWKSTKASSLPNAMSRVRACSLPRFRAKAIELFFKLERYLFRKVLTWLLVRRASGRILRFGPRAVGNNSYVLGIKQSETDVLHIEHLLGTDVVVRCKKDEKLTTRLVPLASLEPSEFYICHFWGEHEIGYWGLWAFLRGWTFRAPYLVRWSKGIHAQLVRRWVNKRSLAQASQLKVLQVIADAYIREGKPLSAFKVMSELYGSSWSAHPGWQEFHDKLGAFLDLLVDAGDLTKKDAQYTPTGSALKLIETSERDDRKHASATCVQVAIALVAAVQLLTVLVQPSALAGFKTAWTAVRAVTSGD